MSAIRLASRYAKAILDLAIEKGELENVYQDINGLKKNLTESSELRTFFKSPIINPSKKLDILDALYKGKVSDFTYKFYQLVVKKRREIYLPEISDAFVDLYQQNKGIVSATVTTATPIDDELLEKIKAMVLSKSANTKEVQIQKIVKEDILGGFILEYGDKRYDNSIASKLGEMKKKFKENKYEKKF